MKKYIKYLIYIFKHKYYVFKECVNLGIPLRGLVHDLSKLRLREFKAYTDYFYNSLKKAYDPKGTQEAFDLAWLYHQHSNKHHWQYWVLNKDEGKIKALEMPIKYRKELLADWKSFGHMKGLNPDKEVKKFYKEVGQYYELGKETRKWIEKEIGWKKEYGGLKLPIKELIKNDLR